MRVVDDELFPMFPYQEILKQLFVTFSSVAVPSLFQHKINKKQKIMNY